eukprot:9197584-Prorocentrum_lima.AAC.1
MGNAPKGHQGQVNPVRMLRMLCNSGGACAPATDAQNATHPHHFDFPGGVGGWDGGLVGLYDG